MKRLFLCFTLLALLLSLPVTVSAEEATARSYEEVPSEYTDFLESLPKELLDILPEELFSRECKDLEYAAGSMSQFSYLLKAVLLILGQSLPS